MSLALYLSLGSPSQDSGHSDEGRPSPPDPREPVPAVPPAVNGGPPSATGGFRAAFIATIATR
jgi:hypothetical protein